MSNDRLYFASSRKPNATKNSGSKTIETFADMFASSTPPKGETYRGCPVVQLPDAPEDLRHLLRVLIPSTTPVCWRNRGDPLPTLHVFSAIIRLSHKYHIERLEKQALDALKEHYCSTFDAYDDGRVPIFSQVHPSSGHMVEVIQLARLTDTPSLLPVAFYECLTRSTPRELMRGWRREDGTVVRLSEDDLERCLVGRERLAEASFDRDFAIVRLSTYIDCKGGSGCREALHTVCSNMDSDRLCAGDPLSTGGELPHSWSWWAENWSDWFVNMESPCQKCIAVVRDLEEEDRQELWARLPAIFDITVPGWPGGAS